MGSLVGTTLGQHRIVEQISIGGMATVFKAYQPALDRYVAVKVLPAQHALTPGFPERFTREAKAVAQLNHPNILPIYDFGQEGDLSYIVMKYVPGGTLKDRLGQPLNLQQATRFIEQIAGALDHAHGRGILHRDVKPSNVLLDEGDWALLTDFGLAKMIAGESHLTASGVGIGTPAYMSPEQGKGEKVDQRSDIYSLGVVLYEMLTGRVPYEAETPLAVVLKHIEGNLPLPRSINPNIAEAVERVILKAMAKEPVNRYRSAGEMAEALKRALEAPVATAVPVVSPPEPEAVPAVEPVEPVAIVGERKRPIPWLPLAVGGGVALLLMAAAALLVPHLLGPRATSIPASPTPRPNGALIFEDDFDDPSGGAQPLFGDKIMTFAYVSGEGRLTSTYEGGVLPVMYGAPEVGDFFAEFDFHAASAPPGSGYGLIFRSDDAEGGLAWYYELLIRPADGTAGLHCWKDSTWVVAEDYKLPPGLVAPTGTNHVRLEAVGGEFRVFINGAFVFETTDTTLATPGIFGLFVVSGGVTPDTAYFDNLRIYAPVTVGHPISIVAIEGSQPHLTTRTLLSKRM